MLTLVMPAATARARPSSGTPEEPCSTRGTGTASRSRPISGSSSTASRVVIACDEPTATARASTPVADTNAAASVGSVRTPGRVHAVLAADLAQLGLDAHLAVVAPGDDLGGAATLAE